MKGICYFLRTRKIYGVGTIVFFLTLLFSADAFSQVPKAELGLGFTSSISTIASKDIEEAPAEKMSYLESYLSVQMRKDSALYLTLGYVLLSSTMPVSATDTSLFTSNSPCGGFTYYTGPTRFFSLTGLWCPYVQGEYSLSSGSEFETWNGSGAYAKAAFYPKLGYGFALELSVTYYSANYDAKSIDSTAVTTIDSFTQSVIAPTLGIQYMF